jgi:hypothetical protein
LAGHHEPLKVFLDASGQAWRNVPGYGLVNWSTQRINEHARYVWETHRPDQPAVRVRIELGFLPLVIRPSRYCKVCQTPWMCREARWADDWFWSLRQSWR